MYITAFATWRLKNGCKATVGRFNGMWWEVVGYPDVTNGEADYINLIVYNGTPYISFKDYYYGGRASVGKFNGTYWEYVGMSGFSSGVANDVSMFIENGNIYVAYTDWARNGKATVMKYSSSGQWQPVGVPGFSGDAAYYTAIYVKNGTPYVGYRDYLQASVMTYDGSSWKYVGDRRFTPGGVGFNSLIMVGDTPYMAFTNCYYYDCVSVVKYDEEK